MAKSKKKGKKKKRSDEILGGEDACPACGAFISADAEECPICRVDLSKGEEGRIRELSKQEDESAKDVYIGKLLEWQAAGYEVSGLEELMQKGEVFIKREFEQYEKNIEVLEKLKEEIDGLEVMEGFDEQVSRLLSMLDNPDKIHIIEKELNILKKDLKLKELEEELNNINPRGLEKQIEEARSLLSDPNNIPELEKKIKDVRRSEKEMFFQFAVQQEFKPPPVVKKKKVKVFDQTAVASAPVKPESAFLFYRDGRLLSFSSVLPKTPEVHTSLDKTAAMLEKQLKERFLGEEKEFMKIELGKKKIFFLRSRNIITVVVITGEEHKLTQKLMQKVSDLVERKYVEQLHGWDGSPDTLLGSEKYMNAQLQTFIKLDQRLK